jgi:hypothetical protein
MPALADTNYPPNSPVRVMMMGSMWPDDVDRLEALALDDGVPFFLKDPTPSPLRGGHDRARVRGCRGPGTGDWSMVSWGWG